jgi:hypothetical protein
MAIRIGTIAVLANSHPLHIGKQANQHPRVKAFSVRHNELVSIEFWSQSQCVTATNLSALAF